MTNSIHAQSFRDWLSAMRESGLAKSDAACARALGVSPHTIVTIKQTGLEGPTVRRTKLAMSALLNQVSSWGDQ